MTSVSYRGPWWTVTTIIFWVILSDAAHGGTIQVLIRVVPEDSPVEIIRITLFNVRGGGTRQTVTIRDERSVSFSQIRAGVYSVRAESSGFQPVETRVELNSFARSDHKLTSITLRRLNPKGSVEASPETSATVSVRSLRVPSKAQAEMEKASRASRTGKAAKAIKHLNKALEIHPDFHEAYNNLAVEYVRTGKVEAAIEALERAIVLNPGNAISHRNLAELRLARGDFENALEALEESRRLQPGDPKTRMLLGEAHLGLNRFGVALLHFRVALEADQRHRSYLGMATCYWRLGHPDRALEEFRAFLEKHPKDPRVPHVRKAIAELEKKP